MKVNMNSIMVLHPYWKFNTWVFTDPITGLVDEPFVAGFPAIIDEMVKDIPNAIDGFIGTFSGSYFPDYTHVITKVRTDEYGVGTYYQLDGTELVGWLCPALFKYFTEAPDKIYIKVEGL